MLINNRCDTLFISVLGFLAWFLAPPSGWARLFPIFKRPRKNGNDLPPTFLFFSLYLYANLPRNPPTCSSFPPRPFIPFPPCNRPIPFPFPMYATSQYSGESSNSQTGQEHSGQHFLQLNRHSRPFNCWYSDQHRPYASTPYAFSGLHCAKTPTRSTPKNANRSRVASAGGRLRSVLLPCTRSQSVCRNIPVRLQKKSTSRTRGDSSSQKDPGVPAHISLP